MDWLPRAEVGGKWEVTANGYRDSFSGDKTVLKLIVVMMFDNSMNMPKEKIL